MEVVTPEPRHFMDKPRSARARWKQMENFAEKSFKEICDIIGEDFNAQNKPHKHILKMWRLGEISGDEAMARIYGVS
jgi:hypothetical protein